MIRITLGALFGLMLTLPFGFDYFMDFCKAVTMAGDSKGGVKPSLTVPAVMLVLPFILGFSTSLVILILNRLVTAVQGFFGQPSAAPSAVQAATPPAPGVS